MCIRDRAQLAPRVHRNRPLSQLTQMADVVSGTILARALERPLEDFDLSERPPLATLA